MDYMDEWDPDWSGDPKISTLKKMAFQAQKDIFGLKTDLVKEMGARVHDDKQTEGLIAMITGHIKRLTKENDISNLYFQDKISKEEAKRLWTMYKSPDDENHKVADAAIESINNTYGN